MTIFTDPTLWLVLWLMLTDAMLRPFPALAVLMMGAAGGAVFGWMLRTRVGVIGAACRQLRNRGYSI